MSTKEEIKTLKSELNRSLMLITKYKEIIDKLVDENYNLKLEKSNLERKNTNIRSDLIEIKQRLYRKKLY